MKNDSKTRNPPEPLRGAEEKGHPLALITASLFDAEWYLERNLDVRALGLDPLEHFLQHGLEEGRNPHPLFSSIWYLEVYPDVKASGVAAFAHFVQHGMTEWRDPHPLFDTDYYVKRFRPDLDLPPFVSFVQHGEAAGHIPTLLFDADYYLERHADVVASQAPPFAHFIRNGLYAGYSPLRLFDNRWYLANNTDFGNELTAIEHFLLFGIREGRDSGPLFRSAWYREQYRDQLRGMPPLLHYLRNGDLKPNRLFEPAYVAKQIDAVGARQTQSPQRQRTEIDLDRQLPTIVFTSIALNYLPFACVLAESLKRHNPDVHFTIILCDEPLPLFDVLPPGVDEIILVRELVGDGFSSWAFQHDIVELCTAAKGFALEFFLTRRSCERVIYLDPDILVTGDLAVVEAALDRHSVVVTPHLLSPEKEHEAIEVNEFDALRHGAFNLGFLAVRNDAAGTRFAAWWRDRLSRYCHDRRGEGLFVDQKWMDLAPGFFPELGILRHAGCNVAPWNLSRRQIEGNQYDGFTVNGQPLIFFHFSGHANGAGDGMISRFASNMAAAGLLASLYRHRLAAMSADGPAPKPWRYATYDNGVLIKPEERHLYRGRKDLQASFPNPFSTIVGASYLHWYRRTGDHHSNAAHAHIGPLESGRTLLEAFLAVNKTDSIRPNPLLDLEFYMASHADVANRGHDPFEHFLDHGLAEGRQSCAEFDVQFYAKQINMANPAECFFEVLDRGIRSGIRPVKTFIQSFDQPVLERMAARMDDGRPRILMISHDWGGGTGKHVRELCNLVRGKAHVLTLMYTSGKTAALTTTFKGVETLHFPITALSTLAVEALRMLKIDRVHVHHAVGMDVELFDLLRALGCRYDITLHDTFFLTPNPMFAHTSESRSKLGLDDAMAAGMGTPIGRPLPSGMTLAKWRNRMLPMLRGAERLIAPTHFISDLYRGVDPQLHPIVVAHHEIERPTLPLPASSLVKDGPLTIAVIGGSLEHKGEDMLFRCAFEARKNDLPLRFVAFGAGAGRLEDAGVVVVGAYDDRDLPDLIERYDVHVLWLPYTAPESYCYALTVALWSGRQLLATDVGCFPERTFGVPQATVMPVGTNVATWLEAFRWARSLMIAGQVESRPVVPPEDTFYPDVYLEAFNLPTASSAVVDFRSTLR